MTTAARPKAARAPAKESPSSVLERVDLAKKPKRVFIARRPIKVGDKIINPGSVVPGAAGWLRIESWVRAGKLVEQGAGHDRPGRR